MNVLLRYFRPFWPTALLVILLVLMQSFSQLFLPTLMADIVDKGIAVGDIGFIMRSGVLMLLVAALGVACAVAASYFSARTGTGYGRNLRRAVFARILSFSLQEYDRFGAASLITRTTNDVTQVQMMVMGALRMAAMAPLMMIGSVIMALSRDVHLSRMILFLVPVLAAAVIALARIGVPLFKAIQEKLDRLNLVLRENLTGIRVIRAFNRDEYESRRFDAANLDLTRTAVLVNRLMAAAMPGMMALINLAAVAAVWFGGRRVAEGTLQVGSLMAFLQYLMQILFSLMMVSMMFVMLPRAMASVNRIRAVLETEPGIADPPEEEAQVPASAERALVEFRNVTFRYPGAEVPVLRDVSFCTRAGEVTAIIGGTGAGKSTLVNLLLRFYDVDSGSILVNGVDIRRLPQEVLRKKIGYVPQQALLFSGSVADNIRCGKEDAGDEEVRRAAEVAQALDFIMAMPRGFDSEVAQGGVNLSGGQKQRLAIARALVRRPEIYIFDDSFSALDFRTDARLRRALREEVSDAVILIVAQRVSTVMDAQRIVVLDAGKVAGIGTHKELLESCPVYREIVYSQLSEEEIV